MAESTLSRRELLTGVIGMGVVAAAPLIGYTAFSGQTAANKALMVYDEPEVSGPVDPSERNLRRDQNRLLADIIRSHWGAQVDTQRASLYTLGRLDLYDALIYSGYGDAEPPEALLKDLSSRRNDGKPVCIINSPHFSDNMKGFAAAGREKGYTNLSYNETTLPTDPQQGVIEVEGGMGGVEGEIIATAFNSASGAISPLIVRRNNWTSFLYEPFSFRAVDDRLLAMGKRGEPKALLQRPPIGYKDHYPFLNEFHRIFGRHEGRPKLALLRLEDVSPNYPPVPKLEEYIGYLNQRGVKFSVATIPHYLNPPAGVEIRLSDNRPLVRLLRKARQEGNMMVTHGLTHQRGNEISGDGYEFWNNIGDRPFEGDSENYFRGRMRTANSMMAAELLADGAWEFPHVTGSADSWNVAAKEFRMIYQSFDRLTMPFPYLTFDGVLFIPENLGYVSFKNSKEDRERIKIENVIQERVFEDPNPSTFLHPFMPLSDLQEPVEFLLDRGYAFVSPAKLRYFR